MGRSRWHRREASSKKKKKKTFADRIDHDLSAIAANISRILHPLNKQRKVYLFCAGILLNSIYSLSHYPQLLTNTLYVLIGKIDSSLPQVVSSLLLYNGPYITTPAGKGESFGIFARHEETSTLIRINVLASTSMLHIRQLVSEHLSQAPQTLILLHFGRVLYDQETIHSCNLMGGSMILVMSVIIGPDDILSNEYTRGSHMCAMRLVARDTAYDFQALHLALSYQLDSILSQPAIIAPFQKFFKTFTHSLNDPLTLTAAETEHAIQTFLHLFEEYIVDQDEKDISLVYPCLRPLSSSRKAASANGLLIEEIMLYLCDTLIEVFERTFMLNLFFSSSETSNRRPHFT